MRWRPFSSVCWSRLFATGMLAGLTACAPTQSLSRPAPAPATKAVAVAATLKPPVAATTAPAAVPDAVANARHLLNRFAYGPRPGEAERVSRMGGERWFEAQLAGPEESPLLEVALSPHREAFVPPAQLVGDWLGDGWEAETRTLRELRQETKSRFKEHLRRLATAELTRHILSQRQLEAVMTDFWANHFNVYASKGFVQLFVGDYLERALRPHALGKFSDLLLATARHPAMLLYLDNADSRRENPDDMTSGRKRRGLNENYARELLELHTLGADGGYSQRDVQEVARILTGWSVMQLDRGRFQYQFKRRLHDRGEKSVLGHAFPAGENEREGVRLLELLARHPATGRNLARRLCARFVADEPPASCVAAATSAYQESDGDIKQVLRAIVKDSSFWAASARGSKLKTPLELVASAARALGAQPDGSLALAHTLEALGEPLLQERVPTGYPDSEPEWSSGGAMLARMTFASQLGEGKLAGLRVPWDEVVGKAEGAAFVDQLGAQLLGARPESRTLELIREQTRGIADPMQRRAAVVALLAGSPEFQRQ
ncbi:MAG TPA: DUF1800 domain-containing protein [Polyangiaceae bacterium]|nr:DUF1800 domain-containing protein [Polyangiaceae bacterium]